MKVKVVDDSPWGLMEPNARLMSTFFQIQRWSPAPVVGHFYVCKIRLEIRFSEFALIWTTIDSRSRPIRERSFLKPERQFKTRAETAVRQHDDDYSSLMPVRLLPFEKGGCVNEKSK